MRKVIIENYSRLKNRKTSGFSMQLNLEAVHGGLNLRTVILMYALFMCVRVIII